MSGFDHSPVIRVISFLVEPFQSAIKELPAMKKVISIFILLIVFKGASAQPDSIYFPVRLSAFDVTANNNAAKLHWSTVCYLQYANFQIQVSADGENYKTIHSFTADRYRCSQPFDFMDHSPAYSGNVFYRINVGNIDGKFFSSEVRKVHIKEKEFDLISVYPTVVTSNLKISMSNDKNESFSAVILNASGSVVKKQQLQAVKGIARFNMNTSNLSNGFYLLHVFNANGDSKTARFLKL